MISQENDGFEDRLVFSDEAIFHVNGKVNKHDTRIWGTENPHELLEHQRDSPKVTVFCAMSKKAVYGPFFLERATVNSETYLDILENWLMNKLSEKESGDFIFQQDGAPPHWSLRVRQFLNTTTLPDRWIGRYVLGRMITISCPGHPDLQISHHAISFCGDL